MNNKGQTLVMFVMLFPLIILIVVVLIEQINLNYQKVKVDNILNLTCRYEEKKEFILKNDKDLEVEIKEEEDKIIITTSKETKAVMSKILGVNNYKVVNKKVCKR